MTISVISTYLLETFPQVSALDFFFYNAVLNGFAMAVYVPLILVLNFKYLPPSARPKPLNVGHGADRRRHLRQLRHLHAVRQGDRAVRRLGSVG